MNSEEKDEEIVPEPSSELEAGEEGDMGEAAIKKLRERIKRLTEEKQEYLDLSQRLKADYLNLKKEGETEKAKIREWANADLLLELLNVADSFSLALGNQEALKAVPENWRQGVEYIYQKLQTVFRDHGLLEFKPQIGDLFNPESEQAVEKVVTGEETEDGKVVAVVQSGYRLHDKVVRPAQVKVASWQLAENN